MSDFSLNSSSEFDSSSDETFSSADETSTCSVTSLTELHSNAPFKLCIRWMHFLPADWNHPERKRLAYDAFRSAVKHRPVQQCLPAWNSFPPSIRIGIVWKAARSFHPEVLGWTLNRGRVCPNIRDGKKRSLLHVIGSNLEASVGQILPLFQFLIRKGCQVHWKDQQGKTALHCVCGSHMHRDKERSRGYIQLLKLLLDAGADVNAVVRYNRPRRLSIGTDPNGKKRTTDTSETDSSGITPLHLVHESPWAIKFLLENGARPSVEDAFQRTPLVWCLRNPHYPRARWIPVHLFRGRMDFRRRDSMGNALLHYAVFRTRFADNVEDIVRLMRQLVDAGADINAQNRRLQTPLFTVIHKDDLRLLAVHMLRNGADVNLCDADGYTVVHLAAVMGKLDYVALFLPFLRYNYITPTGQSVQDCLDQYCHPDEVQQLLGPQLIQLNSKPRVATSRRYKTPFSVWEYISFLDEFREVLSLYVVDTFFRYRGGRSLFSDFFYQISHSSEIVQRAKDFRQRFLSWNGSSRQLIEIIDDFSTDNLRPQLPADHPSHEAKQIGVQVQNVIETLMEKIRNRKDNPYAFDLDVVSVGSVAEGSKIYLPDEYDFLIVFRTIRQEEGDDLASIARDHITQIEDFRLFLIESMQIMDQEMKDGPLSFQFVDCELRRVCLNIRMTWKGLHYPVLHLSVDLTPIFRFPNWSSQSGFRSLRPFDSIPDWFPRSPPEHFRPVYNCLTIPPSAPTMESRVFHCCTPWLRYCLKLLKLIVQTDYIIENVQTPNSHFLKTALFSYVQENGLPSSENDVADFVYRICLKFRAEWKVEIPFLVADASINTPFTALKAQLVEVLGRRVDAPEVNSSNC